MQQTISLEALRKRAQHELCRHIERIVSHGGKESMNALMAIASSSYAAQAPALHEFAAMYNANRDDWIANIAKTAGQQGYPDNMHAHTGAFKELCAIALRAREEGIQLIDRWDARSIATLVDLFPECVQPRLRRAGITCYVEDDEHSTWKVVFDSSVHRPGTVFADEGDSARESERPRMTC